MGYSPGGRRVGHDSSDLLTRGIVASQAGPRVGSACPEQTGLVSGIVARSLGSAPGGWGWSGGSSGGAGAQGIILRLLELGPKQGILGEPGGAGSSGPVGAAQPGSLRRS